MTSDSDLLFWATRYADTVYMKDMLMYHRAGCWGPHRPEYMPYSWRGSRNWTTCRHTHHLQIF